MVLTNSVGGFQSQSRDWCGKKQYSQNT